MQRLNAGSALLLASLTALNCPLQGERLGLREVRTAPAIRSENNSAFRVSSYTRFGLGQDQQRDNLQYAGWMLTDPGFQNPTAIAPVQPDKKQEPKPDSAQDAKPDSKAAGKPVVPPQPGNSDGEIIDPQIIEAARAGDAVAQYKLGYDYYLGHGISQDYAQTALWWRKAADQGYADAQNNLGVLYNSGKGVPQSYAEAYFWQNLAAARSNGPLQAQFARNRDDSASKLSFFERLRIQKRASRWFAEHPVPNSKTAETKPESPTDGRAKPVETKPWDTAPGKPDQSKPDQSKPDKPKPDQPKPDTLPTPPFSGN